VTGRIASVEFVDIAAAARGYVGLVLGFDDVEELDFWSAMNISDEIMPIYAEIAA
jgi:hypothetical protein